MVGHRIPKPTQLTNQKRRGLFFLPRKLRRLVQLQVIFLKRRRLLLNLLLQVRNSKLPKGGYSAQKRKKCKASTHAESITTPTPAP